MEKRLSPLSALVGAGGALVVSLIFGSGTFSEEVAGRSSSADLAVLTRTLATPRYSYGRLGSFSDKYSFLLLFVLFVALLILATARRGTGFVAGWTATIAAGACAGFGRGLLVDDQYGPYGRNWLGGSLQMAGIGATYGLLIGWGVGLLVLIGTLVGGRAAKAVGPPAGAPTGGWPEPPAGAGPTPPLAWTGGPAADDSRTPPPPARPAPPGDRSTIPGGEATTVLPGPPDLTRRGPSGWSRPSDRA